MSCMMMNPEPLAAIANATETALNSGFNYMGFDAPAELYNAARDLKVCGLYNARLIYKKLYQLNAAAYAGRYQTDGSQEAPEIDLTRYTVHHAPEYAEHHHAVRPWHYRLAKLLDCWLYQTCEGATDCDPFREGMRKFRNALFDFIVERSQEYDDAPGWGKL